MLIIGKTVTVNSNSIIVTHLWKASPTTPSTTKLFLHQYEFSSTMLFFSQDTVHLNRKKHVGVI